MIVDSSALVAILWDEPEAEQFAEKIVQAEVSRLSAASYLETALVVDSRRVPRASRRFDKFLEATELQIEPVTAQQALLARAAYRDYGKGSGHPAQLNFGDCFSYALAKDLDEPLLFKGQDFGHTDIKPA